MDMLWYWWTGYVSVCTRGTWGCTVGTYTLTRLSPFDIGWGPPPTCVVPQRRRITLPRVPRFSREGSVPVLELLEICPSGPWLVGCLMTCCESVTPPSVPHHLSCELNLNPVQGQEMKDHPSQIRRYQSRQFTHISSFNKIFDSIVFIVHRDRHKNDRVPEVRKRKSLEKGWMRGQPKGCHGPEGGPKRVRLSKSL